MTLPIERVALMYADYTSGMSLAAVGRKYDRSSTAVRQLFQSRGLPIRPYREFRKRDEKGRMVGKKPLTKKQIDALVAKAKSVNVPKELHAEWRHWSIRKRGAFLNRIRARLKPRNQRPELPFSDNVEPFDYGTAKAWKIAREINAGRSSQNFIVSIKPPSQGVIWKGSLWFWTANTGYVKGPHRPDKSVQLLHRVIWQEATGQQLGKGDIVRFKDRNPNNLDPANLVHLTRSQLARENQAKGLNRKGRERMNILLKRQQQNERNQTNETVLNQIIRRR